ncbi:phage terminase large subunit [Aeromonas veronii]|uniref:phage terminase large subunit n=1 Tax=Aeromonas veronii TaxID=654 RepID=UPI001C5AF577|nr:phage terminase large subunit [Aeromonas veronii]MBW3783828.1 phage terminase large subunit [Aeromonas veronii]
MTQQNKADLAKYLLQIRDAGESFVSFVTLFHPDWVIPKFHYKLALLLDRLEKDALYSDFEAEFSRFWTCKQKGVPFHYERKADAKKINNAMVNMPPRHSKSSYCTELFPAYYMGRRPSRYCMTTAYNADLASGFGRNVQMIIEDPKFSQVFPDFILNAKATAVDNWRTTDGGAYYSIGVGGTTSGRPATLLIVDDPVKSRIEAESLTQRNRVWDFYTSALDTRLQPEVDGTHPKRLVILTRWHPDDLGGRIQSTDEWKEGEWLHINFKAIEYQDSGIKVRRDALPTDHPKYQPTDQLKNGGHNWVYKPVETALWPERFPLDWLKKKKRLNERDFEALYQQTPYIKGGNLIKESWWQFYTDLADMSAIIIGVDTAFKTNERADYSVMLVAGLSRAGDIYVLDVHRGKWDFPALKRKMLQLNAMYRGQGLRGFYVEDKASGQSLIQEMRRESGVSVIPYKLPSGDKVTRASLVTPMIEGGRVFLPRSAPWLDEFTLECSQFPNSVNDDQVDALTISLDTLSRYATPNFDSLGGSSLLQTVKNSQRLSGPPSLNASNVRPLRRLGS